MLTEKDILEFYKDVEKLGLKFPVAAISKATGYGKSNVSQYLGKKLDPSEAFIHAFYKAFPKSTQNVSRENGTAADKSIRKPKIDLNENTDGITFIPISAQAGYSRRTIDPIFNESLEKLYIPGFPYRGDRFRIWEVEGNSMEPTFKEGFYVLTEKVEDWKHLKDWYAYVIVTVDSVLLKRIHPKNKTDWVLVSDNEELYPQFLLPINEVKELWFVKRKMDWEMAPPKKFEIKV